MPGALHIRERDNNICQAISNRFCMSENSFFIKAMSQVYITNSGVIEFVFLNQIQSYTILYTDDEVALINSEGELKTLEKYYMAQHNLREMVVAKQEILSSKKRENEQSHCFSKTHSRCERIYP